MYLFNHVGGVLKLAETDEVLANQHEDLVVELLSVQLQHVLNQVVPICIFNEGGQVSDDDVCEFALLALATLLQAALHDAASVFVRSYQPAILHAGLENELSVQVKALTSNQVVILRHVRGLENAKKSLNYVVSVRILNEGALERELVAYK